MSLLYLRVSAPYQRHLRSIPYTTLPTRGAVREQQRAEQSLEVRYFHTDTADSYTYRHRDRYSVERVDSQTIRLVSDDVRDVIFPL